MFYHSELTDQYRTLNGNIYAVHQSFSGFNTAELGRPHSAQLSLVVWELALTCDGAPLFAICATLARILFSLVVAGLPCCFTAGGNTGSDAINFLQRAQCSHCKRCISYGNSVCPSVRPSVHLSVCPSVTRRYCVKTAARSTVQFAPLDSKMCLVL